MEDASEEADMNLIEFAHRMPKTELHVHLEATIRPSTLLRLAQRNEIDLPAKDINSLREFYRFRDFEHFIEVYFTVTGCLRTPEDYRLIAYEFGGDCARQNVRYAEVTFTIETNMRLTGLPWEDILAGLNAGREQARQEFGVEMRWIFDILRNNPENQDNVLEITLAARDQGVVALGLGGSEDGYPPGLFVETFERARRAGVARVPHAGELAGAESVWAALDQLHADRLEHGVRSVEDPHLVETLVERQIGLDICPTSNICLGIYPDFESHPLRQLWDAGALLTLNSDDPAMFNTTLNQEYQLLVEHFDFGADELEQISLNGVRASLLPDDRKAALEAEFQAEFARLREELA
jgi:adenosine deaminase